MPSSYDLSTTSFSRRRLIQSSGATLLTGSTGCLSSSGATRGITDIYVVSELQTEMQFALTITPQDGNKEIFCANGAITPGNRVYYNNKVTRSQDVMITIQWRGNEETIKWTNVEDPAHLIFSESGVEFTTKQSS